MQNRLFVIAFALFAPAAAVAQASAVPPTQQWFPNSCNAAAQEPFGKGLLALHNFEYSESAELFQKAEAADPHCAIAYWGQAMTYWHELWGAPDATEIDAGKAATAKADALMDFASPREKHYIAAMKVFWPLMKDKESRLAAAKAYTERMKTLHDHFSDDHEATLFYALALLSSRSGTRDERLAQSKKAGELIEPIFVAEPWNPGAAHYLIHAYDWPELAPQALTAARAYAKIAPDAPHALHMPAHIFAQLGLWQEMVDSNQAAYDAAHAATGNANEKVDEELHAIDFWQYAQLQLGEFDAAQKTTALGVSIARAQPKNDYGGYDLYGVPWRVPVEMEDWQGIEKLQPPAKDEDKYWAAEYAWLQVLAAAHLHDRQRADAWLKKLEQIDKELHGKKTGEEPGMVKVLRLEDEGWDALADGNGALAVSKLQEAVDTEALPDNYGDFREPALEMLGDVQLALGHKAEAAAAYKACLAKYRGRRLSVAGLKAAQG